MISEYEENAKILKALSDPNRLKIIDLLSCGEKCACEILESFNFTQPTLSHHMKVLIDCGLVEARKVSIWNQYKLIINNANRLVLFLLDIVTEKDAIKGTNQGCYLNNHMNSINGSSKEKIELNKNVDG